MRTYLLRTVFAAALLSMGAASHAESYSWMATVTDLGTPPLGVTSPFAGTSIGNVISGRLVSSSTGTSIVNDAVPNQYEFTQWFSMPAGTANYVGYKLTGQAMKSVPYNQVSHEFNSDSKANAGVTNQAWSAISFYTTSDPLKLNQPANFGTGDVLLSLGYHEKDYAPWSGNYVMGYPTNLTLSADTYPGSKVTITSYSPSTFSPTSDYYMVWYRYSGSPATVAHYVNGKWAAEYPVQDEVSNPSSPFWSGYESYKAAGNVVPTGFQLKATIGALSRIN